MAVFDFSRWRPSAILDFQKLEIITARTLWRAKMHHLSKFCANLSRHCGDMAVFVFLRWRPSAILDLLYACLDHPRVYFGGLRHCAKFGLNRFSIFDNMQVLIFWALSLKVPIHALFWVFLGQKFGKTETLFMFIPPKMQLTQKHAFWGITCQNRSSGLTPVCAKEATKK